MRNEGVTWKMVTVPFFGGGKDEMETSVVEYDDGSHKSYWVKRGNLYDAIYRSHAGLSIVGVGVKRYEEQIIKAISIFKDQKWRDDTAWKEKESNLIRVIKGGKP